jgi:hypothetical protein
LVLLLSWVPNLVLARGEGWPVVDVADFPGTPAFWFIALAPLVAGLFTRAVSRSRSPRGAILRVRFRWGIVSVMLPALWVVAILVLAEATGLGRWPRVQETASAATLSALRVTLLVGLPVALAQEVGWRAFLLPRLLPRGRMEAALVVGLVWATAAAPVFLWTRPYENVPAVTGMAAHLVHVILLSLLMVWFFTASGRSLWVCVVAHAMLWTFAGEMTRPGRLGGMPILVGSKAILGSMALVVWVWWLYVRGKYRDSA